MPLLPQLPVPIRVLLSAQRDVPSKHFQRPTDLFLALLGLFAAILALSGGSFTPFIYQQF